MTTTEDIALSSAVLCNAPTSYSILLNTLLVFSCLSFSFDFRIVLKSLQVKPCSKTKATFKVQLFTIDLVSQSIMQFKVLSQGEQATLA